MSRSRSATPPKYRHHKARNLAKVSIGRRDVYLGTYNSPESWQRYAEVIAAWRSGKSVDAIASGQVADDPDLRPSSFRLTVGELSNHFWSFARDYYTSPSGLSRGRDLTPVTSTSDYERIHPGQSPERIF